jgi:hypothetical protein
MVLQQILKRLRQACHLLSTPVAGEKGRHQKQNASIKEENGWNSEWLKSLASPKKLKVAQLK